MRLSKRICVLCVVIVCCIVVTTLIGVVAWHGEWWYPLGQRWKQYPAPALTETAVSGETTLWSFEELILAEGVSHSCNLLLVNASHPLPEGYEPSLVEYNGAKIHPLMRDPYVALRDDVQAATGVRIYVASDYRTAEEQAELIASSESGIAAPIGCSEHEAGLALDVYAPYFGGIQFLRSRAGRMVNEICEDYGYIIRYPSGKEDVTGIEYEPWHIRYVGAPHASIIMNSGITLEEYIELLTPGVWYVSGEYLISRRASDDLHLPNGWTTCDISSDNTGYFIVTLRMG